VVQLLKVLSALWCCTLDTVIEFELSVVKVWGELQTFKVVTDQKKTKEKRSFPRLTAANSVILFSIHLKLQDKSILLTSALAYSYMLFHLIHNQST